MKGVKREKPKNKALKLAKNAQDFVLKNYQWENVPSAFKFMLTSLDIELKSAFMKHTPKGEIFTFWKGRVALYCFLKSLKLDKKSEVLLPGLTCVVVPNAILYAGLTPVYIDVNENNYVIKKKFLESWHGKNIKLVSFVR